MMKTDIQLHHDVVAELQCDPLVNAEQIEIAVKDGIVAMSGRVNTYKEKLRAEVIVQRLWCVKALAANRGKLQYSD